MKNMKLNKNGRISNVLLSVLALFIVIVVILFIINKANNNRNYDQVFNENLNNLFETAKDYFSGNLPEEEGTTNIATLRKLYDLSLSDKLTYGNNDCDEEDSYISITKISNNEYNLKANLKCGLKEDNIIEKIKSTTTVEDEHGNEITNDEKDDIVVNKDDEYDNVKCFGPECTFIEIPTHCETTYAYEFVRRTASCYSGYTYSNGSCIKDETLEPELSAVKAKLNTGLSKIYGEVIKSTTEKTYSCKKGELNGKYCYEYEDKDISCPSGYPYRKGSYCYKYKDYIESEETTCPSGYPYKEGNYCYNYKEYTKTENKVCPSGYSPATNNCTKTVAGETKYTEWGNPTKTYQVSTKESTYTNELSKKVLIGTNTVKNTTIYTYAIYQRSKYTYCASGTPSGTSCILTKDYEKSTTNSCTGEYKDNGTKCYIKTPVITSTDSICPSGYKDNGTECYKRTSVDSNCPSGYKDNGTNCYKRSEATVKEGTTTYSCTSKEYTKTGTGSNTKCYKEVTVTGAYYCENENAKLVDNLCYLKGNTCTNGYSYNENDKLCHKQTSINPSYNDTEIIYSEKTYIEGYQRTGRASYKNICTRVSK